MGCIAREDVPLLPDEAELQRISERLTSGGALALILIDAKRLARVERQFGGDAYLRAMEGLRRLVAEVIGEHVRPDDLLVGVERSSDELHVFLFRPRGDRHFYGAQLLELSRQLTRELERQSESASR